MPAQTDRVDELQEAAGDSELPYVSKSRVKTYKQCPRKFYYKYIQGMRPPENFYMKRGSRIHKVFEIYYENLVEQYEQSGVVPDTLQAYLPEDSRRWADFIEPYISNFLLFELRRLVASPTLESFMPVGIEAEGWDETMDPVWMGHADAIFDAASLPNVETDDGVVIVDFKTGKTPKPQYRDSGIFLEGEYYAMLFEREWQVSAVAGYYPKNDDFIISELDAERREDITQMVNEMNSSQDIEDFPTEPQPLCRWSENDDDQCDFYDICPSKWGEKGGPGPTYD
jgi:CRISPR/Cas system-associated exonuclease Cas4 (RecB family)